MGRPGVEKDGAALWYELRVVTTGAEGLHTPLPPSGAEPALEVLSLRL